MIACSKSQWRTAFCAFSATMLCSFTALKANENNSLNYEYGFSSGAILEKYSPSFDERWSGDVINFAPISKGDSEGFSNSKKSFFDNKNDYKVGSFKVRPEPSVKHLPVPGQSACGASSLSPADVETLVRETARKFGVDEELAAAIAWTESRFDQNRNSPAGARGAMQLMPATAVRFGVRDVCDTRQNVEGGVKYLRMLLEQFPNPFLAIAAYNSGENRIYEYGGIPPFPETVSYVSKVFNRQIGAEIPKPKSGSTPKPTPAANLAGEASGVIPVSKNGKFVAGIMHF